MRWTMLMTTAFSTFLFATGFAGDANLNVDFTKVGPAAHIKMKGSFEGPLPLDCKPDFPLWNSSDVETKSLSENGRDFLRFEVRKVDSFGVFFRMPEPPPEAKLELHGYYKMQVVCRCPDAPLNLILRVLPAPYTTLWEEDIEKGSDWVEKTCYAYVEENKGQIFGGNVDLSKLPLAFYLSMKLGNTDIASIKLSKIAKEEYVAVKSIGIQRPEKGQKNLFRNSRFPLGLQSGWSVCRDNSDGEVIADPSNLGPSGYPSLKITARTWMSVYSEPFQSDDPSVMNHVSFAFKGFGSWKIQIIGKGGTEKTIKATKEWQTADIEFSPAPFEKAFSVVFSGSGSLLQLDSLMAYSGNEIRKYASADECEIALAPSDSETSGTRIQFSDTPSTVKYFITGNCDGATLKAKVVNIDGQERILPDRNASSSGMLDFGVFPEAPLGAFRIEAWVERGGKRISPFNEIVISRVRRPIYWGKDAPNSPFGNHFWPNPLTITTMKAAGINWERVNDTCLDSTCWGWLEPEKGKWKFADNKVALYRKAHMKILGYLGSAPKWASYFNGQKSFFYFDYMYQPKDIDAFKNYIHIVASHYRGVIDEYQFQNEPYGEIYWHIGYMPASKKFDQGATPALDYANLSKIAYEELKAANPDARFYGFNTNGKNWTQGVFDGGAYPYCDMMDYHFYTPLLCGFPGDPAEKANEGAFNYVREKESKPLKPIVMSEGNATRSGIISLKGRDEFTGLYKHSITWQSMDQSVRSADMTCRFVVSHLALGVKRVFLYSDHCYTHLLEAPSFPVLLGADGYPHPSLSAFSNMAWLLEDRPFVKRIQVGEKVWAHIFEGRSESVAAICGEKDGHCILNPSKEVEFMDLFGNRIDGKVEYKGLIFYAKASLPSDKLVKILSNKQ